MTENATQHTSNVWNFPEKKFQPLELFQIRLLVALLLLPLAQNTHAAIISIFAYNSYQFLQSDGTTPLADGSWVMIIGTTNSTIREPDMQQYGTSPEGDPVYLADSVMPGDTLITMTRIFTCDVFGGGFIETPFAIDTDMIQYFYLRIFDYQQDNIGGYWGLTHWNYSDIYHIDDVNIFGELDFAPDAAISTTMQNHFAVIPEPNTMLFSLWGASLIFLARAFRSPAQSIIPAVAHKPIVLNPSCKKIIMEILRNDPWLTEN